MKKLFVAFAAGILALALSAGGTPGAVPSTSTTAALPFANVQNHVITRVINAFPAVA